MPLILSRTFRTFSKRADYFNQSQENDRTIVSNILETITHLLGFLRPWTHGAVLQCFIGNWSMSWKFLIFYYSKKSKIWRNVGNLRFWHYTCFRLLYFIFVNNFLLVFIFFINENFDSCGFDSSWLKFFLRINYSHNYEKYTKII